MKMLSIMSFYFLSLSTAQAALEGDYVLIAGPKSCPIGSISMKVSGKERNLLFGNQLSWTLNLEDKSEFKEVVEEGCTYVTTYEKTVDTFKAKTVRSACPNVSENAVINEEIEFKNSKLNYQFDQVSGDHKKTTYKCTYNRRI
jgi:hypothetical protein